MTKRSVFLAVPYSRPHYGMFVESLLLADFGGLDVHFRQVYGYPVDYARNYLVQCFLADGADYLLFVDNDCSFDPGAVKRLVSRHVPMIGGCMYTREFIPRPTAGIFAGRGQDGKLFYKYAGVARRILERARSEGKGPDKNAWLFPERGAEADLVEVDGMGMHMTLIRRDVVEAVTAALTPGPSPDDGRGGGWFRMLGETGAGEDFYFCDLVKKAGFKMWLDLTVQTGHCTGEEHDAGLVQLMIMTQGVENLEAAITDDLNMHVLG